MRTHRLRRVAGALAAGGGLALARWHSVAESKAERTFSAEEVAARDGTDGRPLWVSFRGGVHDVTEFVKEHPGGRFIEQAAGGDVEGFWKYWFYHFHSPKVAEYAHHGTSTRDRPIFVCLVPRSRP